MSRFSVRVCVEIFSRIQTDNSLTTISKPMWCQLNINRFHFYLFSMFGVHFTVLGEKKRTQICCFDCMWLVRWWEICYYFVFLKKKLSDKWNIRSTTSVLSILIERKKCFFSYRKKWRSVWKQQSQEPTSVYFVLCHWRKCFFLLTLFKQNTNCFFL